jgi:hypothetical protein
VPALLDIDTAAKTYGRRLLGLLMADRLISPLPNYYALCVLFSDRHCLPLFIAAPGLPDPTQEGDH